MAQPPLRPSTADPETSRAPLTVVLLSSALAVVAAVIVARDGIVTPAVIALCAAAALLIVVGLPSGAVAGGAVLVGLIATFTLSPNNGAQLSVLTGLFVAIGAMAIALARIVVVRSRAGGRWTGVIIIGVFLGLLLAATAFGTNASDALVPAVTIVVPGLLVALLARAFTQSDMRVFARGFLGYALVQVVVATIDLLVLPVPFLGYSGLLGTRSTNQLLPGAVPREQALAGHPIIFSLVLIVAALLIWRNTVQLNQGARAGALMLLGYGVVLSGTRSAVLAVVLALVFVAVVEAKSAATRIRNVIVVLLSALLIAWTPRTRNYLYEAVNGLAASGSYTHRVSAWENLPPLLAGRSLFEFYLGSGAGSERSLFNQGYLQQDGLTIVDNQFITTLVTSGVVGLAVLLLMLVRSLVLSGTLVRGTMITLAVFLNTFDLLRWPGPALLFFVFVALGDHVAFRTRRTPESTGGSRAVPIPIPDSRTKTGRSLVHHA